MTKEIVSMSVGKDNSQLRTYEYVLFAADETVVARKAGYRSLAAARRAGRDKAELLTMDNVKASS